MKHKVIVLVTPGFVLNSLFKNWFEYMSENFDVETLSSSEGFNKKKFKKLKIKNNFLNLSRKPKPFRDFLALFKLYMFVKKNLKNTIYFSSTLKISFLLCLISFFLPIKYVYLIRGLPYENKKIYIKNIYILFEKLITSRASQVGVISIFLKKFAIEKLNISKKKLYMVGNGSSNGIPVSRIKFKQDKPYDFCFAGRICEEKGIYSILNAFKKLKSTNNISILFIGRLEGNLKKTDISIDGATYIPWCSNPSFEIAKAKCFLYPSDREGFGNAPLEAASVGVPSIVTNINGLNETIIDKKTGLYCRPDRKDLIDKMQYCIKNEKEIKIMGLNSYNYVKKFYSQKKFFKFYKKLFSRLIEEIN